MAVEIPEDVMDEASTDGIVDPLSRVISQEIFAPARCGTLDRLASDGN